MNIVGFNGWRRNARLCNGAIEVVVTLDVGPRVIRCGFVGQPNLFAELRGQQGGSRESQWMIRGGHRFWIAPESKPDTYELDNAPVEAVDMQGGGIRTRQAAGPLTSMVKIMEITMAADANRVAVRHILRNEGKAPRVVSPWALSVMSPGGEAVIPLPAKVPHTERLTHTQEWSLWGYTDFADPRWIFGSRYLRFRQDRARGPNKLGIAHREGWVAYVLGEFLFVKEFSRHEGLPYPDGGVNFETFANEDFLELESLGPLVSLAPGEEAVHEETWRMYSGVPRCVTEDDLDRHVRAKA